MNQANATRPASEQSSLTAGDTIRGKIEANRRKRLAIADAMKSEAGVRHHDINYDDNSGYARIGRNRIYSPHGRNMLELYTVAHECGHIFLHNDQSEWNLPGHVMELEAESYAHQAFVEYGMQVPKWRTQAARDYVRYWIEKDRAANIQIDPRAEMFANGTRSPFLPLRKVPSTWRIYKPGPQIGALYHPAKLNQTYRLPRASRRRWQIPFGWVWQAFREPIPANPPVIVQLQQLLSVAAKSALYGLFVTLLASRVYDHFYLGMKREAGDLTWDEAGSGLAGAAIAANVAVMIRTMWR